MAGTSRGSGQLPLPISAENREDFLLVRQRYLWPSLKRRKQEGQMCMQQRRQLQETILLAVQHHLVLLPRAKLRRPNVKLRQLEGYLFLLSRRTHLIKPRSEMAVLGGLV